MAVASKEPHPQELEQRWVYYMHQDPHQVASLGEAQGALWPEAPAPAHHFWGHADTAQPCFPCPQRPQPHLLQAGKHRLPRALCTRQAGTGTPGKGEILNSPTPCSALHTHH